MTADAVIGPSKPNLQHGSVSSIAILDCGSPSAAKRWQEAYAIAAQTTERMFYEQRVPVRNGPNSMSPAS